VLPIIAYPSPVRTARAGHNAGRLMPDAARGPVYGRTRGTAPAPPSGSTLGRRRPGERDGTLCNWSGDGCQGEVAIFETPVAEPLKSPKFNMKFNMV